MRRKGLLTWGLVLVLVVLWAPAGFANLITNGSFESGADPGGYLTINSVDSTSITDWTVASGSVDYIGSYWVASQGSRSLDMNGYYEAGAIEQTFKTVSGQTYRVTFDLAGNPDNGPTTKTLLVAGVGGDQTFTFDTTGKNHGAMGWVTKSFDFIGSGSQTTLHFEAINDPTGAWGPALDNVTVNAIPIPPTLLLLGSGLVGVCLLHRRRSLKQ